MIKRHAARVGLLVCLASLAVVMAGTLGSASQQGSWLGNFSDRELKEVVIRLERTKCYGSCPAYKLTIHGNGRVVYIGEDNVKEKGKKHARIGVDDVRRLVSEFERANYFSMNQYTDKDCSCVLCTDMPTAITEIKVKGIAHRVEHYYGCTCPPPLLWELEQTIDKIVHTEQWTGDVSKQGPLGTACSNKQKPKS